MPVTGTFLHREMILIISLSALINIASGENMETLNKTNNCQVSSYLCKPTGLSVITSLLNTTSREAEIADISDYNFCFPSSSVRSARRNVDQLRTVTS